MTTLNPAHPVRRRPPRRSYSAIPGETPGSPPWRMLKSLILAVCVALVVLPFVAIISTSLADTVQVTKAGGYVMWPHDPTLGAYRALLSGGLVSRAMLISVGITVVGTALSLFCSIMLAYGLSRPGSYGHKPVLMLLLMSMLFAPGVIPSYLMIKQSPHLSGENIRDYPYLANIPTASWAPCVRNGGIYALPMPRPLSGGPMYTRLDLIKERDLDPNPKTWDEFVQFCKDVTDSKHNQYALGDSVTAWEFVMKMQRGPNNWREENGRFTWYFETEEAKQALEAVRQLTKAGVMHPDTYSVLGKAKDWFGGGQTVLNADSPVAWNDYYTTYAPATKGFELGYMMAPSFDGNRAGGQWQGSANYATLIIKKAPGARIQQILRAMNALAAPFGTDAYLLRKYGVRGPDHTLQGTDPVLTPQGQAENTLPTIFATDAPFTLYYPAKPDIVPEQYEFQKAAVKQLIPNPAEPLYSPTDSKKSKLFGTLLDDTRKGIMQGRLPLKEWDAAMKNWRKEAGDQIRREFEQAWEIRNS
ncbi:extracellular solute-binding protein [Streptomyces sp. NPDC058466]|uniref:extracellular solute-binding protein n=1 Tax=Streptomyces sp. NPDC058466 TaxID=3346512 RepID=UPI003664B671